MRIDIAKFIKECPVYQINKPEHNKYPGMLQPLPVPDMAWTHISMDFVEGLPISENKDLILVVVDRFTIYAHFISMKHPITVKSVAKASVDNIFRLHSLPTVIVTDRDRIITSHLLVGSLQGPADQAGYEYILPPTICWPNRESEPVPGKLPKVHVLFPTQEMALMVITA